MYLEHGRFIQEGFSQTILCFHHDWEVTHPLTETLPKTFLLDVSKDRIVNAIAGWYIRVWKGHLSFELPRAVLGDDQVLSVERIAWKKHIDAKHSIRGGDIVLPT